MFFILIGQPSKPVIVSNDTHVECTVNGTSQPEGYGTPFHYDFIFGNKSVKSMDSISSFEIPKIGPKFNVACSGYEVGSKYVSKRSENVFIDEKGEDCKSLD